LLLSNSLLLGVHN